MSVHPIRLRGPWRYAWLSPNPPVEKSGRVSLPAGWSDLFGTAAGRIRFSRTFHCPTNLDPDCRLDLVFEGIGGDRVIRLNNVELIEESEEAGIRCRIEESLSPTNHLDVEIEFDPAESREPGGLWGSVVLEIHES